MISTFRKGRILITFGNSMGHLLSLCNLTMTINNSRITKDELYQIGLAFDLMGEAAKVRDLGQLEQLRLSSWENGLISAGFTPNHSDSLDFFVMSCTHLRVLYFVSFLSSGNSKPSISKRQAGSSPMLDMASNTSARALFKPSDTRTRKKRSIANSFSV